MYNMMDFNLDNKLSNGELLFQNDINTYLYNCDLDYHKIENYILSDCLNYNDDMSIIQENDDNTPLAKLYSIENNEKTYKINSNDTKNNINAIPFKKLKFPSTSNLITNFELHSAENYKKEKETYVIDKSIPINNLINKKNKKICYVSLCKSKLYKDILCKYHYNYHNNNICEVPNCRNMIKKNKLCYKHCRPLCLSKNCKNNTLINSNFCKRHYHENNTIDAIITPECEYNNMNSLINELNVYIDTNDSESIISDYDILQNEFKTYII